MLLSLHLKNELQNQPPISTEDRKPNTTDTHSCSNKEISIHRGHKEVIIIAMSLSDIYNPKEDMPVQNTADLKELNERIVKRPRPTPKINSTLQKLKLNPCNIIRPDHGLLNH